MLTVTETAKARFAAMLDEGNAPEEISLRLVANENGLGIAPDVPKDGDETYDLEGKTVLVVDRRIAEHLKDRTIDVAQTEAWEQLRIS